MNKKQEKLLTWLYNQRAFIKVIQVENALGMGQGTLKKYFDGRRDLPEHWIEPLAEWTEQFIKVDKHKNPLLSERENNCK